MSENPDLAEFKIGLDDKTLRAFDNFKRSAEKLEKSLGKRGGKGGRTDALAEVFFSTQIGESFFGKGGGGKAITDEIGNSLYVFELSS